MSKLTNESRSALLSARAKNRKLAIALGNAGLSGVSIPKNVVTKVNALETWFESVLAPAAKDTGPVQDQEAAVADEVIAA